MANKTVNKISKAKADAAVRSNLYDLDEVVLPWENADEFVGHRVACREAFNPQGQLQEEEVFEIARLYWVKRRNNVGYHNAYFKDLPPGQLKEAKLKGPEAVRELIDSQAALQLRARESLWAFASQNIEAGSQVAALLRKTATGVEGEGTLSVAQREELRQTLEFYGKTNESLVPLLNQIGRANPEFERQNRLDLIEKHSKVNAEIDRQIDKRIARLVNLKEFSRLYGRDGTDEDCIDVTPVKIERKNT